MHTLSQLALQFNTDKAEDRHGYVRQYTELFEPIRREPIRLLELGVLDGASIRMWQEYFPSGEITALDCEPRCMQYEGERIKVYIGAQQDRDLCQKIAAERGPFDIVIDDASHYGEAQKASLTYLYPHLKPGGYYIIEDLHTSYWGTWGEPFVPTLLHLIEQVLYPGGRGFPHGHGDIRNHPEYEKILDQMDYFTRATRSVQIFNGMAVFKKWDEDSGWENLARNCLE